MVEVRLGLDWELWVVEQLLFTGKRDDLADTLAAQGVDRDAAAEQIDEILRSVGFQRLRRRLGDATLAVRLQRLQGELLGGEAPTERADVEPETLLREHWIPSRPLLLTETARVLAAVRNWSFADLVRRFGAAPVAVNVARERARCSREVERIAATWPLADLIERMTAGPSNDFYVVSRNGLLSRPEFAPLWDDLRPLPAFLRPAARPRGVSLWLGPSATVTPPHFDPHNVLLVQVLGRKRIRLAPRVRPGLHDRLDGYYLNEPLEAVFAPEAIHTLVLEPGHALFVPVGWLHEVTALEPSATLSFIDFIWPNHFHWLGPPGSDDREPRTERT